MKGKLLSGLHIAYQFHIEGPDLLPFLVIAGKFCIAFVGYMYMNSERKAWFLQYGNDFLERSANTQKGSLESQLCQVQESKGLKFSFRINPLSPYSMLVLGRAHKPIRRQQYTTFFKERWLLWK